MLFVQKKFSMLKNVPDINILFQNFIYIGSIMIAIKVVQVFNFTKVTHNGRPELLKNIFVTNK